MEPNVTTVTEAARLKGCTRQVYNAFDRGDLNTQQQVGGLCLILKDQAWQAYGVKETGGRKHRSYQEKRGKE